MSALDEIRAMVAEVQARANDDEAAHCAEDRLLVAALERIAAGAENAAELARTALETQSLDFSRWCA